MRYQSAGVRLTYAGGRYSAPAFGGVRKRSVIG